MQHERHHQVADDHDHQIGRKVVGALVVQFLAAYLALVRDFQEGAKHMPLPAVRAAPRQATPQGGLECDGAVAGLGLWRIVEEIHAV